VPHARIVAVADPVEEAAKAACSELEIDRYETDYRRLLEDDAVDAVIIVTPTKYHCEIAVAAAKAGKHILCEKPMAMTVEECNEMDRAAKENGVKLQLAFMRRFDASFMQAKKLVDEGAIGDVVMVRSNTRGPSIPKPWMYDISKSNGPLAEVNSHDIDTLRWFTGSDDRCTPSAATTAAPMQRPISPIFMITWCSPAPSATAVRASSMARRGCCTATMPAPRSSALRAASISARQGKYRHPLFIEHAAHRGIHEQLEVPFPGGISRGG